MSKFDVSDLNAAELNQAIDDTNFPSSSTSQSSSSHNENHFKQLERTRTASMPVAVKPNGFAKSFSDDVFDIPGTPKTPRSVTTPGNIP